MKHEIPVMLRSGGGAIVNNSSIGGHIGFPGASAYVASKFAVIGLTKTAALEFAKQGIRVNSVSRGRSNEMFDRAFGEGETEVKENDGGTNPIGRIGTPEEIASAVLWLSSPGAAFTTGQDIIVDGGYTARWKQRASRRRHRAYDDLYIKIVHRDGTYAKDRSPFGDRLTCFRCPSGNSAISGSGMIA